MSPVPIAIATNLRFRLIPLNKTSCEPANAITNIKMVKIVWAKLNIAVLEAVQIYSHAMMRRTF